ncbi:MAG: hypothetical protein IJQ25_05765 [Oscillibacter sp.]|nr:hypothetical protein [Oscillibacter sp.]
MTSGRVTATMISRASNGIWNGGRVPFGYDYNPETMIFSINETEARVVRMIHDMYEKQRPLPLPFGGTAANEKSPERRMYDVQGFLYAFLGGLSRNRDGNSEN